MADNISITQGTGTSLSTDDVGAGLQVQRVKVQWGVDGTGTDVSNANPLPVNVTHYPASAALTDANANPTTTMVGSNTLIWNSTGVVWSRAYSASADALSGANLFGAGNLIYNGATFDRLRAIASDAQAATGVLAAGNLAYNGATYDRVRVAKGDGTNVGGVGVLAVTAHLSNANNDYRAPQSANSTADASTGTNLAASAPSVYNGASYDRLRGSVAADGTAATGLLHAPALRYNGATYDRERGNVDGTALASSARTAQTTSSTITNHNARGVVVTLNVTVASGTGGLTIRVQGIDPVASVAYSLNAAPTAVITTGLTSYVLYPGGVTGGAVTQATAGVLPRTFQILVGVGDASSYTYSVGYSLIV